MLMHSKQEYVYFKCFLEYEEKHARFPRLWAHDYTCMMIKGGDVAVSGRLDPPNCDSRIYVISSAGGLNDYYRNLMFSSRRVTR